MREREQLFEIIFVFLGFTFSIGAHSISEEVVGFILYGFPKENSLCLLSLVIIDVHFILSNKILELAKTKRTKLEFRAQSILKFDFHF